MTIFKNGTDKKIEFGFVNVYSVPNGVEYGYVYGSRDLAEMSVANQRRLIYRIRIRPPRAKE